VLRNLIFICLLLPPSDFEVSVYAETTYSLHDNVVIRITNNSDGSVTDDSDVFRIAADIIQKLS